MSTATEEFNPFAEVQAKAHMMKCEEKATALISDVRQSMVLGKPNQRASYAFFTTLLLKMNCDPAWWCPTACTDGKRIWYNPEFVSNLTMAKCIGLMVHEVMHVANLHHTRCGDREPRKANIAMDLAINGLIKEAGFELPEGGVFAGEGMFKDLPVGLSFEEYYRLLPDNPKGKKGKGGSGGGTLYGESPDGQGGEGSDPGGCGSVIKPGDGSEAALAEAEADAQTGVAQARNTAQQMRGTMPAGLARMIERLLEPKINWKEILREFVSRHAKNEYGWSPPNRRYIWQRTYLPSLTGTKLDGIVIAIDTSGSIGPDQLNAFASEINGIIQAHATKLTILFHDAEVAHTQTWEPTDGDLVLEPKGGGGTDHRPVFRHIEQEGIETSCLVCLTDMCSVFPTEAPEYPVLWVSTVKGVTPPFGNLVYLDIDT